MGKHKIKIGIIGGSGLDDVAKNIFEGITPRVLPLHNTPYGVTTSAAICGEINGIPVVLISRHGEGHKFTPSQVDYRSIIDNLKSFGCTHILATTACGSLTESISPGQLVVPDSVIDRTYLRKGTFYDGSALQTSGVCHVPMEPLFDRRTSDILVQAGKSCGIDIKKGATMVTIEGPRFSTKAESLVYQQWGGDLVNMTTCPEVFLAKEAGIPYAAIAMATDYDCWRDPEKIVCVADVMQVFQSNVNKVTRVLVEAVKLIGQQDWDKDIDNLRRVVIEGYVSSKEREYFARELEELKDKEKLG